MKRYLSVFIVLILVLTLFAGCSSQGTTTTQATTTAGTTTAGTTTAGTTTAGTTTSGTTGAVKLSADLQAIYDKVGIKPVLNTTGKEFKIAVICVTNNSFWFDVLKGVEDIKKLLADPQFNAKVDLITVEKHDGQLIADAIDNCVTMQYDAICTVGSTDAIIPAIDRSTKAGIPVYTFNSDVTSSSRVAFVGQDLYAAGVVAGETMAKLIDGKGKVAVITGFFNVPAHEKRRLGAYEAWKKFPDIKIVGEVEDHDNNDEGYTYTKDFITANPDLAGIYITAGGQQGVTKALAELKITGNVKVVMFDFMAEVIDAIYAGNVQATIGQDPYAQGANPVVMALAQLVAGKPVYEGDQFTNADVVTIDNVKELFPR